MYFGGMCCCFDLVGVLVVNLLVLFLDEFMIGLDLCSCSDMWEVVKNFVVGGIILLFIM